MSGFVGRIEALALTLGAPGVFLVAFLDSSFLSLPEIADLLVIWMVMQHESLLFVYAAAATAGSLLGCLLMYFVGKKGGEALMRKRFRGSAVDRAMATVQRYGIFAVLIPSILPPPAPFKIFVLLAGVANIGALRFAVAITIGRGTRYLVEGFLAVRYGDQAIEFIRTNGRAASYGLVMLLVAALAGYIVWTKASARKRR